MITDFSRLNGYQIFNALEAVLWWGVALTILIRVPQRSLQERLGSLLGSAAFLAFGVSDLFEMRCEGLIPLWLWGLKCLCGTAILASRYTWLGWSRFCWSDREVLFGIGCLLAVLMLIVLQNALSPEWLESSQASASGDGGASSKWLDETAREVDCRSIWAILRRTPMLRCSSVLRQQLRSRLTE